MPLLYASGSEIFVIAVSVGFHTFWRHILSVSPMFVTLTGTKDTVMKQYCIHFLVEERREIHEW